MSKEAIQLGCHHCGHLLFVLLCARPHAGHFLLRADNKRELTARPFARARLMLVNALRHHRRQLGDAATVTAPAASGC
jgi:hypothetical protein